MRNYDVGKPNAYKTNFRSNVPIAYTRVIANMPFAVSSRRELIYIVKRAIFNIRHGTEMAVIWFLFDAINEKKSPTLNKG